MESSSKKAKKFNYSYWDFINQIKIDCRKLNLFITIRNKDVLNNKTYQEYLNWDAYKKYLLSLIDNKDIFNVKESIIYSSALGIDYQDFNIEPTDNNINKNNFSYYYFANMFLFDEIHSSTEKTINNSNASSDNFNSFSSGSSFTGGGGGGSGAF